MENRREVAELLDETIRQAARKLRDLRLTQRWREQREQGVERLANALGDYEMSYELLSSDPEWTIQDERNQNLKEMEDEVLRGIRDEGL